MLCSIEIGTVKGHKQSQVHYWVVAETLVDAIEIAMKQVKIDYDDTPNELEEYKVKNWQVIDAEIKSVDDPLTK